MVKVPKEENDGKEVSVQNGSWLMNLLQVMGVPFSVTIKRNYLIWELESSQLF